MKILFVIPPFRTTDDLIARLYPMPYGVVLLATILKHAGHAVTIKDFLLPSQKTPTPAPPSAKGLGGPRYIHYGTPLEDALKWLQEHIHGYDVVGMPTTLCNTQSTASALAKSIHAANKPLVIGGPFATTATEQAQQATNANVVVVGEGEHVVEQAFEQAAVNEHTVIKGPPVMDLDAMPMPDWSLALPSQYPAVGSRVRAVTTVSRGCPHACEFCSVHTITGRQHRRKSPERIRAEILNLWRYGASYICFLDDDLFISKRHADIVLGIIEDLKRTSKVFRKTRFYCEEGLEVRMAAQPGLLKRIKAAGFDQIVLGLETMNAERRKQQKKPYLERHLAEAVRACHKARVPARAFYIVGLPGDTVASVTNDLVAFGKLGLAVRSNNLKLYPGTTTTAQFLQAGYIDESYDWRLSSWYTPDTPELRYPQVKQLKALVGAIGKAAEEWQVALFADEQAIIALKAARCKYKLTFERDGSVTLTGNLFRATPLKHIVEMLCLRFGAAGAKVDQNGTTLTARPTAEPASEVQAALVIALRKG